MEISFEKSEISLEMIIYNNVSLNDIKSFFNNSYREIEKYQNM